MMAANFSNDSIELDNEPDRPTSLPKNPSTKNLNDKNNKTSPTAKSTSSRAPSSSSSPSKVSNNSSKTNNAKNLGTNRSNVLAKKTTRANLQNRSPDELYAEIVELKKALTIEKDDNSNLKVKLRRSEDENNRKIETNKAAGVLAANSLKKKIQRLEQMVKERDSQLKKMQNNILASKLQVDTKKESQTDGAPKGRTASSSGMRDLSKPSTRAVASQRSPGRNSGYSSPSTSPAVDREQVTNLINENKWLRIKLYRALGSCDEQAVETLTSLNATELIAEINKLKQELEGLAAIKERIESLREGRSGSANGESGWQEKVIVMDEEMKKLRREVTILREDCASYLKDAEAKQLEVVSLKQDLVKAQKSTADGVSRIAKPRVAPIATKRTANATGGGAAALSLGKTVTLVPKGTSSPRPSSATGNHTSTAAANKPAAASDRSPPKRGAVGAAKTRATLTTKTPISITTKSNSPAVASRTVTKTEVTHSTTGTPPVIKTRTVKSASAATTTTNTTVTSVNGRSSAVPHVRGNAGKSAANKTETPAVDDTAIENFRQNVAAKKIQKSWKDSQQQQKKDGDGGGGDGDAPEKMANGQEEEVTSATTKQVDCANGHGEATTPEEEREAKLALLRQSGAARTIQKNWKAMKKNLGDDQEEEEEDDDDDDLDEVVTSIQSAVRSDYERNGSVGASSGGIEVESKSNSAGFQRGSTLSHPDLLTDDVRREHDQRTTDF